MDKRSMNPFHVLWLLLPLLVCPAARGDPCTQLIRSARVAQSIGIAFSTPLMVKKCLGSFRFTAQRDLPVIDTVISGLDTFYVYKQLAKSSPSPRLPSKIDVVALLQAVRTAAVAGKFNSTFSFFEKIGSVVQSLNDGHTTFIDNCMQQPSFLGLPVFGVVEKGVQRVRVIPLTDIEAHLLPYTVRTIFGLDVSKYAGKLVHSIEGMDAFKYVLGFADKYIGVSRDIGTRLNIALSRPTGTGTFDYGMFGMRGRIPVKDYLTYKIWKTSTQLVTVRVPFMTFFNASFSDKTSYWNHFCQAASASNKQAFGGSFSTPGPKNKHDTSFTPHMAMQSTPLHIRQFPQLFEQKMAKPATALLRNINPKGYFPVYLLNDGTAVIVYFTFAGVPSTLDYTTMLDETTNAFQLASSKGKRVLLDMSGNGGGYTLLAWFLMRALVGSKAMPLTSHSPMQFLGSNNAAKQTYTLYEAQSKKNKLFLTPNVSAPAMFSPYRFTTFTRKGVGGYYSNNFVTGDDIKGMALLGQNSPPGLGNAPLLVLTNGNCFSACAIFTHVLQKIYGLKVVTVGGLTNQSLSSSSSCLGFTQESLQQFVKPLQGLVKGLPKLFQLNVDLSFASSAMYVKSSIPCEYVFVPGDAHIHYDIASYYNIGLLWQRAAAYFPKTGI